jgi:NAD(P)-dependent dehydrogenase (short-subunit alcohol dehydrogenase family)
MTESKGKRFKKYFPLGSLFRKAFSLFLRILNRLEFNHEAAHLGIDCAGTRFPHNGNMLSKYESQYRAKTVLVTGGASGIGAGLCRAFAALGATVVIADRDYTKANDLAREIGPLASVEAVDVVDPASVQALFNCCLTRLTTIDVVVNCAGILMQGAAESFSDRDWTRVIGVNLLGTIYVSMAAFRVMTKQGHGQIVNIASGSALNAPVFQLPYVASKYGSFGFTLGLRAEGARRNIRISVVCPGNTATPMVSSMSIKPSEEYTPTVSIEYAVAKIMEGISSNRSIIVFPLYQYAFWYLERISSFISSRLRQVVDA